MAPQYEQNANSLLASTSDVPPQFGQTRGTIVTAILMPSQVSNILKMIIASIRAEGTVLS